MFDSSIKYLPLLLLSSINKEINKFDKVNLVIWLVTYKYWRVLGQIHNVKFQES